MNDNSGLYVATEPKLPDGRQTNRTQSIALLSLAIYLFWVGLYLFVPILSVYARALGASLSLVGLVVGAYGFSQLVVRIPIGLMSDRWGRRKPFVIIAFVFLGLGVLGMAWSPNPIWLLVFRSLTGLGAATWVTTTVLYSSYFPKEHSVRATSLALFFSGAAVVTATAAGGILADAYGWKSAFYLALAPLAVGIIVSFFIADDATVSRSKGPILTSFRHVRGAGLLITASVLACIAQYASYATTFSFAPIYAAGLGASRTELGWLSTAVLLPNTLATLLASRLSERFGERNLISFGLALMALTTAGIPFIKTIPLLMASRAFFGIGLGFVHPVLMGLSIKHVDREQRASAMGFFQAVYAVGMFAGPAMSGVLADGLGLAGMFLLTGAACVVAGILTWRHIRNGS